MFRFVSVVLLVAIAIAGYFILSSKSSLNDEAIANTKEAIATAPEQTIAETVAAPKPDPKLNDQLREKDTETVATQTLEKNTTIETTQVLEKANSIDNSSAPLTKEEKKQAKKHIENITAVADKPIEIKTANHFVTADQLLKLPAIKEEIAKIEDVEVKTVEIKPQNNQEKKETQSIKAAKPVVNTVDLPEKAETAKSFAVKIPSFKKQLNTPPEPKPELQPEKQLTDTQTPTEPVITLKPQLTPQNTETSPKHLGTVTASLPKTSNSPQKSTILVTSNIDSNSTLNSAESESVINTLKKKIETLSEEAIKTVLPNTEKNKPELSNTASIENKKPIQSDAHTKSEAHTQNKTATGHAEKASQTTAIATVKNTIENNIKLRELLNEELLSDTQDNQNKIFYLHAVNAGDEQGIWGIIQQGLVSTFSKGIKLKHSDGTLTALIPDDADELLSSKKSSFLGKLLNDKVLTTYVYNYEQGNIGKNPDFIKPGQQLIIVTFTEKELLSVFQHFTKNNI